MVGMAAMVVVAVMAVAICSKAGYEYTALSPLCSILLLFDSLAFSLLL
jgi:hypothetical protein